MEKKTIHIDTDLLMSVLALLPLLGLLILIFYVCASSEPLQNKTEVGMLFGVLGTLCKDSYGYFFGSSKKGNSSE